MSPAPVRRSVGSRTFPYRGGYVVGLLLMVAGVVVAIVLAVNGFRSLVDDVNDFRRAVGRDNLEETLEAGVEYVVYDEDGIDVGPFDIRVIRISDGTEIPTTTIENGTTYDVDGRRGRARVGFQVPTSDIYRVELDTSVSQLTRVAVGGDVTDVRSNAIVQGLVFGAVLVLLGLVVLLVTAVLHARWKVRTALEAQVSGARQALRQGAEQVESAGGDAASRASAWTHDRLDQARAKLSTTGGEPGGAGWQESIAAQARQRLDQIDTQLSQLEPGAGDVAERAEVGRDAVEQADRALGRIQERLAAGESLRAILRDEREAASRTARELASRAPEAQATVTEQVASAAGSVAERGAAEASALGSDLSSIGAGALVDVVTETSTAADVGATGAAATAAGAATAAAAAGSQRLRSALGVDEVTTTEEVADERAPGLPPPPPPPVLDEPEAEDAVPAVAEQTPEPLGEDAAAAAAPPGEAVADAVQLPPVEEAAPSGAPADEVEAPATAEEPRPEPAPPLEPAPTAPGGSLDAPEFVIAPPPVVRALSTGAGRIEPTPAAAEAEAGFSVLAPPPAATRLALSSPERPPTADDAADVAAAHVAADDIAADDDGGGSRSDGFALAPPPAYRGLPER